jgi:hypothetical protein
MIREFANDTLPVNLAKHQVPKSKVFAMSPGYGRIHEGTGSIYWQIDLGDKEVDMVSRRGIADQCLKQLSADCEDRFLPRPLRTRLQQIPRFAYGARKCTVILDDHRSYDALIRWYEILQVRDHHEIPFDPARIVDVTACPGWDH